MLLPFVDDNMNIRFVQNKPLYSAYKVSEKRLAKHKFIIMHAIKNLFEK